MFFKNKSVQALLITTVFSNILRLVSNLILARMLNPEAFAITGLASTVLIGLYMLSDGGFRLFTLKHKDGDEDYLLNTLWTVKLLRNLVMAVLLFTFSKNIANFFNVAELDLVLKVICLSILFDSLSPMSYFTTERQNRVITVMYLKFSCSVISTVAMIIGIYFFPTYWTMVAGMVGNTFLLVFLGYVFLGTKGSWIFIDKKILTEFWGWTKYVAPSSIITLALLQMDKVVLGKFLSTVELGLYYIAFSFSSAALTLVSNYISSVLEPHMSRIDTTPSIYAKALYDSKTPLSSFIALSLGGLSGVSFLFFDILYGEQYLDSSKYLSILLLLPIFALISYPARFSLILQGKVKMTLYSNIIKLAWFVIAGTISYYYFGVFGLIVGISLIELPASVYMLYEMKKIGILRIEKEAIVLLSAVLGFMAGYLITFFYKV